MNDSTKNILLLIQEKLNNISIQKRKLYLGIFALFFIIIFAIRILFSLNIWDGNQTSEDNDTTQIKINTLSVEDSVKLKILELELKSQPIDENVEKFINDIVNQDRKEKNFNLNEKK